MADPLERLKTALADRYILDRELGRGGMAVVYLAQDQKLNRQVALKVLRPELAASLGAERFLREIEIAAQLTHPNILGLYDCGKADDQLYYTMPFVEGESLRDRLNREKQLPIDDALQITKEVADALGHAHSLGIVHRDIKPENILFQGGHALVADFGIARAVSEAGAETLTETGLAIGTPAYMSPEQATGTKEIDARSDLYSLGCVLYEMLAGEPPYTGTTAPAIVAKKLSEPTPRVSVVRELVPDAVEQAMVRALAKTPADRFATAAQFTEALYAVGAATAPDTQPLPTARGGRRRLLATGAIAAALLMVIAVALVWTMAAGPISITPSNIVQLTHDPGLEYQPAMSPDGSEVAYIAGFNGRVVVQSTIDIGLGESRPSQEVGGYHLYPRWTPDNASLNFLACAIDGSACSWKEVGKLGGPVRPASVPPGRWAWSRDGTRVAFAVGNDSLFAYSVDNGEPELLGVHVVDPWRPHSLAWSPDGRLIAYVNGNPRWRSGTNVAPAFIWIVDAEGGAPVPVTGEEHLNVSPQWLPDSRHLLFVSDRDGSRGIYVVEVGPDGPEGTPQSVLSALDAHSISISADGRRLAYTKFPIAQNIWSIPIPQSGSVSIKDAVPVTEGSQVIEGHSLSPDGEWIVFDANRRGQFDIYKQRLAGGQPELVADITADAYGPKWSPEGSEITFFGAGPIWIVSADGGTPEQVTDFPGWNGRPDWSPDGLAIAYQSPGRQGEGPTNIWIVSRDSIGTPWSDPLQLTDFGCQSAQWAPDGASLVCRTAVPEFVRVSLDGEVLSRHDASTVGLPGFGSVRFSRDGSRIYFFATHEDGWDGAWWMPTIGGDANKAVAFDDLTRAPYGVLTVGPENLYFSLTENESDIWVMDLEW